MPRQTTGAPTGRPPYTYSGSLGRLVDKMGGGMEGAEALAARIGIQRKSLQRLAAGRGTPSRVVRMALRAIAKEHHVRDPFPDHASHWPAA